MRPLIAIAAVLAPLVVMLTGTASFSIKAEAGPSHLDKQTYFVIDKTSMDYFWMTFDPAESHRLGWVDFEGPRSNYAARRYMGRSPGNRGLPASFSTKVFTVYNLDRDSTVMEGSIDGDNINGNFYNSSGRSVGEFTATKDYKSDLTIFQVCSQDGIHFYCIDTTDFDAFSSCPVEYFRSFSGKFTHLDEELCATEIERVKNK